MNIDEAEQEAMRVIQETFSGQAVNTPPKMSPNDLLRAMLRPRKVSETNQPITPLMSVLIETTRITLGARARTRADDIVFIDKAGTFRVPEMVLEIRQGPRIIVLNLDLLSGDDISNLQELLSEGVKLSRESHSAMHSYLQTAKSSGLPFPAATLNGWVLMTGRMESVIQKTAAMARFTSDFMLQVARLREAAEFIRALLEKNS